MTGQTGPFDSQVVACDSGGLHGLQAGGRGPARSCQIAHGTERISGHPRSTSRVGAGPGGDVDAPALPKLTMAGRASYPIVDPIGLRLPGQRDGDDPDGVDDAESARRGQPHGERLGSFPRVLVGADPDLDAGRTLACGDDGRA